MLKAYLTLNNLMMHKRAVLALLCLFALSWSWRAHAQRFSIQTNFIDWATLGTFNAEGGISFSRHFSLIAGARFNPWQFERENNSPVCMKQTTAYVGFRYWPWYVNSGFWFGTKAQYQKFNLSGLFGKTIDASGGHGVGLSLGYTMMLDEALNLEFGAGAWVGRFSRWVETPVPANATENSGSKLFVLPDAISVSLVYVF